MENKNYPALRGLYAVYDGFVLRCPFFAENDDAAKSFLAASLPAVLPAGDRRLDWEVVRYSSDMAAFGDFEFCFKISEIVAEEQEVQPE